LFLNGNNRYAGNAQRAAAAAAAAVFAHWHFHKFNGWNDEKFECAPQSAPKQAFSLSTATRY